MSTSGWIGVDLDGTLAEYHGWKGVDHIGEPIFAMVERVKEWRSAGVDVRIFTARVSQCEVARIQKDACGEFWDQRKHLFPAWAWDTSAMHTLIVKPIEDWCLLHLGEVLPVTSQKDFAMVELWDDRAVQVEMNTGRRMDGAL